MPSLAGGQQPSTFWSTRRAVRRSRVGGGSRGMTLTRAPGQFTQAPGVWAAGAQVAVGDLNGDGQDDVFLYDAASGQWWRQLSDGQGGFAETSGTWSVDWTLVGRRR